MWYAWKITTLATCPTLISLVVESSGQVPSCIRSGTHFWICIISTNKQPRIITASNLPLRGAIYCNGIYYPTRKSLARRPLSMPSKEVLPFVHDEADSTLFLCSVSHTMSLFPLWGSKSSILLCIYICSKTQIILHYTLLFEGADSLPRVAHLTFASWGNDFLP